MSHLSPAAIFSPSIARQQLAAAKDWNYIDSWLSSKFSSKTPPFERNPETLKALLALASLNESADEERELLSRVEAKTLTDLQAKEEADHNAELLSSIEENLSREGRSALDAMAELSVQLNQPLPSASKLGSRILDLQTASFNLSQASDRISILERHLNTELSTINTLILDLQSEAYSSPSEIAKQTTDYQRRAKALASKLPELKDRVSSLSQDSRRGKEKEKITIQDVREEEDKFSASMKVVKDLEQQVKSYHHLPQDTDLARLELEGLRVELQDLTRQRDAMFEGLVERESPKKVRH